MEMINFLDLRKINTQYQQDLKAACARVIDSGWYLQGKENEDFEVYAELALASQDRISAEKLLRWSTITGYQNPTYLPRLKQMVAVL